MTTVEQYIHKLEKAVHANKLSYEVMMPAIEQLSSPAERQAYFDAYVQLVRGVVEIDVRKGVVTAATSLVNRGLSLDSVARDLSLDRFRHLINHYNSSHVHRKWNRAIPDLKTDDGLAFIC
jgi:hypothetical protein